MDIKHETKNYSIFQIAINLTIACLISGIILACVYYFTAPIAAVKAVEMKNQAMQALVENADSFKLIPGKDGWYTAEKSGKVVAYVVPSETKGFGGAINMIVAVTPDGTVIDYNILTHNETPGLGDNTTKDPFKSQFKGKKSDALVVVKDPTNTQNIQAVTGATISSRAVTKGIKEAVDQVTQYLGGKK